MSHSLLTIDHPANAAAFTADDARAHWHDQALWFVRVKRDRMAHSLPEWEELRATASQIKAHTIANLATGLDAANNLIATGGVPDAHWNVNQPTGPPAPAQTVYPNNPDWFGGWVGNGPNSTWIARDANTPANGLGTYAQTFSLKGP